MDRRERTDNYEEAVRAALDGRQAGIWTALPGIIQSFDATKQTASVQPAIQAQVRKPNGDLEWVTLPLLLDCPAQFPAGGGTTLTFPVASGDECLVVFGSRCIDAWWQSGGVQPQAEFRMHDLSDGFVLLGVKSVPNVVANISTTAVELRSDDDATKLSLDPSAQTVVITAPGGTTINANTTINGDLHVTGTITGDTDVKTGSISLKTHTHTGVTSGSSNTGGPV